MCKGSRAELACDWTESKQKQAQINGSQKEARKILTPPNYYTKTQTLSNTSSF